MAKYSKEIVEKICNLLATGEHRIIDVCKQVGISEPTYYEWKESKPEFLEALKDAEKQRLAQFKDMARSGLAKLLDPIEYEEKTIEYSVDSNGIENVRSKKTVTKRNMPNSAAVIFALCNQDAKNFKNIQKVDVDLTSKGEQITGMVVK